VGTRAGEWLDFFSAELRTNQRQIADLRQQLENLPEPMIGNTAAEFGIQHLMLKQPPPVAPFVQIDLGQSLPFDRVVLVPALVDFQSVTQSAYVFPVRFRLDASDDPSFGTFTPLLVHTEEDFLQTRIAPVQVSTPSVTARYLRLTVTKLAQSAGYWTFALSELMVLQGKRNIALHAPVQHSGGIQIPPRWHSRNLTDGRTPLGPPIDRSSMTPFDALFARAENGNTPWMGIDLGRERLIQEIRVHPLHARQGADVPGFRFPSQFRVEVSDSQDMSQSKVIFDTRGSSFSNPGNNPVTFPAGETRGRFVRFSGIQPDKGVVPEFALAEMEVYAGDQNVALEGRALSGGDVPSRSRPAQLLNDGFASYGRILELPQWLAQWAQRQRLQGSLESLEKRTPELAGTARKRALGSAATAALAGLGLLLWSQARARRRQKLQETRFRNQLARDMHDEVGSNLAGIAVLSEVAAQNASSQREDWAEIHRIARETSDALREVLWLTGTRQEMGIDLTKQLRRVAARLLPRHEVTWSHTADRLPSDWTHQTHREVFLFFKESLTNILKHAQASEVELWTRLEERFFELGIRDNGKGFDLANAKLGMGLQSLRERAATLRATLQMNSQPGGGTLIVLRIPL
jgi:signal transduction histidine kinase